jgi:hypothetical protein
MNGAAHNRHREIVDGDQAAEAAGYMTQLEQRIDNRCAAH